MTTPKDRTFIDTNVLLYAYGSDDDPRARTARDVLAQMWHSGTGVVSTQVLQEFYAVATRKLKPPLSRKQARDIVTAYAEWCLVNTDTTLIVSASRREEEHTLAFWDALVIEAAVRAGATKLLSEDLQHGRKFGNLVVENPFVTRATAQEIGLPTGRRESTRGVLPLVGGGEPTVSVTNAGIEAALATEDAERYGGR